MVQGPINMPKDGIGPLSGIIETDWAPYSFTMNWLFTRKDHAIRFEKGEPFCHVFPIKRTELESVEPEVRLLSEDPELRKKYEAWTLSRTGFVAEMQQPGTQAATEQWQKRYHRGVDMDGTRKVGDHRTRLRLKPFSMSPAYKQRRQQMVGDEAGEAGKDPQLTPTK
jgi:hypothetical protein